MVTVLVVTGAVLSILGGSMLIAFPDYKDTGHWVGELLWVTGTSTLAVMVAWYILSVLMGLQN